MLDKLPDTVLSLKLFDCFSFVLILIAFIRAEYFRSGVLKFLIADFQSMESVNEIFRIGLQSTFAQNFFE